MGRIQRKRHRFCDDIYCCCRTFNKRKWDAQCKEALEDYESMTRIIRKPNGDIVIKADKSTQNREYESGDPFQDICDTCDDVDDWADENLGLFGLMSRTITLPTRGMFGGWIR